MYYFGATLRGSHHISGAVLSADTGMGYFFGLQCRKSSLMFSKQVSQMFPLMMTKSAESLFQMVNKYSVITYFNLQQKQTQTGSIKGLLRRL